MTDDGFINLKNTTKLPDEEIDYVMSNPEGLTKEGIEYNIKAWSGKNRYALKKYELMQKQCKTIQASGKLDDGRTILSRNPDGKIWAEKLD